MDWEFWHGVLVPITSLYQHWVTMVFLPSISLDHSSPIRPLSNLGFQMLANSWVVPHPHRLSHRCCDGLRVLPQGVPYLQQVSIPGLGNNGLPSFHLNGSLPPYKTPQILAWAEMLAKNSKRIVIESSIGSTPTIYLMIPPSLIFLSVVVYYKIDFSSMHPPEIPFVNTCERV